MANAIAHFPRSVRAAPDPLGLYVRLGRNDHPEFLNLMTTGDAACFGAVFDPTLMKRHQEVRDQVLKHRLDAILDPKTQPAATAGGFNEAMGKLPWGAGRPHMPADFVDTAGRRLIAALGDFVLEHGFTQVLAPTHLLRSAQDEWLETDLDTIRRLRNHLDKKGGAGVPIIYSLAMTYAMLRDPEQRHEVINALRGSIPASALWLKIDGFGSDSTPTAVRTYIEAAAEFHKLGIPIIADHVGGLVGLSLLSFGAAGGLAHGVTLGERFHSGNWRRPPSADGFGMHQRIYVPQLDLLLKPAEAKLLLQQSQRTRATFGCNDTHCCPRGIQDMIGRPGHHFLYRRIQEVSGLSQVPDQLRPQLFLEQHLRPATDRALAAANIRWENEAMAKKLQAKRKHLDALRVALGHQASKMPPQSFAFLPKTRASRDVTREMR